MDHILLFNRPDGLQQAMPISVTNTSYSLLPGTQIIWNTVTDGPFRFNVSVEPGTYQYETYDDGNYIISSQVGMWVKRYGTDHRGNPGAVPYIDGYITDSFSYIPEHWQWLLDHYRKTVPVYALKCWLFQEPGTAYADANAAVEASFAANPLNKIRWEEREFVPFGGIIFNIILPFIRANPLNTDFEIFNRFEEWLERDYDDNSEDNLPG
jgi:hypothetical protein